MFKAILVAAIVSTAWPALAAEPAGTDIADRCLMGIAVASGAIKPLPERVQMAQKCFDQVGAYVKMHCPAFSFEQAVSDVGYSQLYNVPDSVIVSTALNECR